MSSMAEPPKKTPKTSRFLGCFGFSGMKNRPEKPIKTGNRNKTRSPSCPMLCFTGRKSRTKTVPFDNSDNKTVSGGESCTPSKLIKKKTPSRQNSKADQQQTASLTEGPKPNIPIENRKNSNLMRTGSSLPGSPTVKSNPNQQTQPKLSYTVSLPVLDRGKRAENPRIHDRVNSKQIKRKNNDVVKKFDPVTGLSIIMVTLVIMLLWGRLCAVLCTSAWFYFHYRTAVNDNSIKIESDSNISDLDSEEYKKRIVLEGLLERNHKITL
ncbi:uncharacterized protein At5g23160-like [Hibiscus syriacus]|uniref:uncharacterized protein At5g23160-like n=1 Tax=Hibiscus syriacus TaxID=106335 RepID=UPI0019210BB6|nr:uncharacterized protein At5g23160-like [Hibiscus syriacus]